MSWKIDTCDEHGPNCFTRTLDDGRTVVVEAHDEHWTIGGTAGRGFDHINYSNLDRAFAAAMTIT